MDLIQLILDEAIHVEPTECDNCSCLSEWGHVGDSGWRCVSCCITRPEWAVSTQNIAGLAVAWIGSHPLGSLGVPYCSTGVDDDRRVQRRVYPCHTQQASELG